MKPQIRTNNSNVGIDVFVQNPDLRNLESTYLTADLAGAGTALAVQRGTGFNTSEYLVLDYLTEIAELELTHSSTTPTATAITIAAGVSYAHVQDTVINFIPYNQVEIYTSTDDDTYTLAVTIDIQPDKSETIYLDTDGTAATYYKARFKNATDTSYSVYTDIVLGSGYPDNSVYSIKKRALNDTNEKIGETITDQFLNEKLWEARRIVHNARKRWSFRQEFDKDIGNISAGDYSIAVPTDLQDKNTNTNILRISLGTEQNLEYMTKTEWNRLYVSIGLTTIGTQPSVGDITLVLTDTADLDDSGSIDVFTSGTLNNITWTSKSDTTNTLSGIPASGDGSITATHAAGTNVWQGASFGLPSRYTIFEEKFYFDVPIGESYHNLNAWLDYYKTIVVYDSDADTLDEPIYDMYVNYLIFKIRKKRNQGVSGDDREDPDYKAFYVGLASLIRNEVSGQKIRLIPLTRRVRH